MRTTIARPRWMSSVPWTCRLKISAMGVESSSLAYFRSSPAIPSDPVARPLLRRLNAFSTLAGRIGDSRGLVFAIVASRGSSAGSG